MPVAGGGYPVIWRIFVFIFCRGSADIRRPFRELRFSYFVGVLRNPFVAGGRLVISEFFLNRNLYILMVTMSMFMVIQSSERNDTAVRISKWLDRAVEGYISDRKMKVKFPSKRNFVDTAVMQLLEEKGVKLDK